MGTHAGLSTKLSHSGRDYTRVVEETAEVKNISPLRWCASWREKQHLNKHSSHLAIHVHALKRGWSRGQLNHSINKTVPERKNASKNIC